MESVSVTQKSTPNSMNQLLNMICLPDLLRTTRAASDAMFDLVREPILQACGLQIGHAPGCKRPHGLLPGFELRQFRLLAQAGRMETPENLWLKTYHNLPALAEEYLLNHLPSRPTILSCEMPAWMRSLCQKRNISFLDLRISPLRFGRDIYIALNSNIPEIREYIQPYLITPEELRLEASFLGANLRAHRSHLQEGERHVFDLEEALVLTDQPPTDIGLVAPGGRFLRIEEFSDRLESLLDNRRLLVMVDYLNPQLRSAAEQNCIALSKSLGRPVGLCPQNAYQILSAHENIELIGISSPILQEAVWFDKTAHCLGTPFTQLAEANNPSAQGFLQVHFQSILMPVFWHSLLSPDAPPPKLARLPPLDRHFGREMLEEWGAYEKVLQWERTIMRQAFDRSGGIVHRRRLDALEKAHVKMAKSDPLAISANDGSMQARIQALKDTCNGKTAYILGNASSLLELNIDKLMQRESFWFNKAFSLQEKGFEFRPKYYFLRDAAGIQKWTEDVFNIVADIKFLGREAFNHVEKMHPDILKQQNIIALDVNQTEGNCMFDDDSHFSYDPSQLLYSGYTSVLDAVQVAFYMGYTRVLIGGVDLDYSQPYFYGDMAPSRNGLQDWITDKMRQSFTVARKHYEKNGRLLAKITSSPHLPLEYFADSEIWSNPSNHP